MGLNFEDRDRFLSSVLIRFGEPIEVSEYAERYGNDPRGTVRQLTARLETDIQALATHIEDERHHQLVQDIHNIYGNKITQNLLGNLDLEADLFQRSRRQEQVARDPAREVQRPYLENRFNLEQRIADAVEYHQRTDPGVVARVRMDIRRYRDHLRQFQVRHELLEEGLELSGRRWQAIKLTAYALFLGPVAIFGFLNNVIPATIVRQITRRQPDEAMVAFTGFCSGLVAFPLFYMLQGWAVWTIGDQSLSLVILYLSLLPITGFFFLYWWRKILAYREQILVRTIFRTDQAMLNTLERERQSLVDIFEGLKDSYLESKRAVQPTVDVD